EASRSTFDRSPDARGHDQVDLPPGSAAGEYRIHSKISAGGFGTVYRAEHRELGRPAAVKVLHRELAVSSKIVARFVREARGASQIRHPNIVDIYELGYLPDGRPYFAMELLEGPTLATLVEESGGLSPRDALALLEPICHALSAAHAIGIV